MARTSLDLGKTVITPLSKRDSKMAKLLNLDDYRNPGRQRRIASTRREEAQRKRRANRNVQVPRWSRNDGIALEELDNKVIARWAEEDGTPDQAA